MRSGKSWRVALAWLSLTGTAAWSGRLSGVLQTQFCLSHVAAQHGAQALAVTRKPPTPLKTWPAARTSSLPVTNTSINGTVLLVSYVLPWSPRVCSTLGFFLCPAETAAEQARCCGYNHAHSLYCHGTILLPRVVPIHLLLQLRQLSKRHVGANQPPSPCNCI